jgi:HEAT repeat protein
MHRRVRSGERTRAAFTEAIAARLRGQIASDSVEAKRSALFEIRNYSSPEASRLALPALTDKDEIVRSSAASSVVFLPKDEAARALVPLLGDRAEFVRREAAFALGEVGDAVCDRAARKADAARQGV